MPERTIRAVFFTEEDGTVHDQGAVVDLSQEEADRGDAMGAFEESDAPLGTIPADAVRAYSTWNPDPAKEPKVGDMSELSPPSGLHGTVTPADAETASKGEIDAANEPNLPQPDVQEFGDETDYSKMSRSQLETEVADRGIEVEGTGSNGSVVKDDLVRALSEDDAA